MINLDFGAPEPEPEEKKGVNLERLNHLIGVLQKKQTGSDPAFLIALTFDEMNELADFLEDNALDSETTIHTIRKRLETKIALAEKHL